METYELSAKTVNARSISSSARSLESSLSSFCLTENYCFLASGMQSSFTQSANMHAVFIVCRVPCRACLYVSKATNPVSTSRRPQFTRIRRTKFGRRNVKNSYRPKRVIRPTNARPLRNNCSSFFVYEKCCEASFFRKNMVALKYIFPSGHENDELLNNASIIFQ